ncbi:MAG: pyridoxamine 5'-phosphate oxidase family protein [Armatimonadota bacterium]
MGNLSVEDIKQHVRNAKEVYVSTIDANGYPITRVMFNLHNPAGFPKQAAYLDNQEEWRIYLGTNTSSAKVSQVLQNKRISLYYHKPDSWEGILIAGEGEIVDDMPVKVGLWQDGWEMYYAGGVESPDYTVIEIRPVFAEYYHDLSKDTLQIG